MQDIYFSCLFTNISERYGCFSIGSLNFFGLIITTNDIPRHSSSLMNLTYEWSYPNIEKF